MRLIERSQVPAPPAGAVPAAGQRSGDGRRAWIEALFATHLPRTHREREAAIAALAGDRSVWALLHQARHSLAETNAAIERLARLAIAGLEPLRAA